MLLNLNYHSFATAHRWWQRHRNCEQHDPQNRRLRLFKDLWWSECVFLGKNGASNIPTTAKPVPFDGDPEQYLRFRSNFGDQVESKISLSDSEKMNYLLAYTTGRARRIVENYQGLPNGFHIALQVLKQSFDRNAMIERLRKRHL